jgi:4-alpha-glucanotransferase
LGKKIYIVVLPLHTAALCKEQGKEIIKLNWGDTQIKLPFTPTSVEDALGHYSTKGKNFIPVKELFKGLPFALIKAEAAIQKRGAGILMHITSLPSHFGIGDLGPGAKNFIDFLYRSRQKYWQLLPLNPAEQGQGYSPYSSTSSRAGNTLLISPELLADEGLLDRNNLLSYQLPNEGKSDYSKAEELKEVLLNKAWKIFQQQKDHTLNSSFHFFCQQEKDWLDDFAVYMVLKNIHKGKPWYEWPDQYKHRDENALQKIITSHIEEVEKSKWMQFIFFHQWKALKVYCNSRGVQMIGDLPFYVSYDSVDVWSHRNIFKLDKDGNRLAMAGVPPDAFSDEGQLWGMPIFNWQVLKEQNFDWWIKRLQKNIELFDLLRLDHFRAFSAYWEVPAGEPTSKNGSWQKGPGAAFFQAVRKALGELPFIAEDLGEIDEPVYRLRDQFKLPGMNVLQFAFGNEMPISNHTPHNYSRHSVVYTGTHDNNTTLGWYREEKENAKVYLARYTGKTIRDDEVSYLFCRMAYASVADIAIIPLQDILGLDETARMNTPSSTEDNWGWRLLPAQITSEADKALRQWTKVYNRI